MTVRVPYPPALLGNQPGRDRARAAWDALVERLREIRRLNATTTSRADLERAYLESIAPLLTRHGINATELQRILGNDNERAGLFARAFNMFLGDRGDWAPQVGRTAAGADENVTIPGMPPGGFRTDRPEGEREPLWRALVERLRAAGYDVSNTQAVMRSFVQSRQNTVLPPGDVTEQAFWDAYTASDENPANRGRPRYAPDQTELSTVPPAVRLPDPTERVDPASLGDRFRRMTAALARLRPSDLAGVNALLAPGTALGSDTARAGHAHHHRAAQTFAVQALGGAAAAAGQIYDLLRDTSITARHPMHGYVQALRAALGTEVAGNRERAIAAITTRLGDGRVGVATDLAILLARRHTVGTDTEAGIFQAWAGQLPPGRRERALGGADGPLLGPGAVAAASPGRTLG